MGAKYSPKLLFLINAGLGDVCHAIPILFALQKKWPGMQIELLFASSSARNLVQLFLPDVTGIVVGHLGPLSQKIYQIIKWRKKRFDFVLSGAHLNSPKTAIIAYLIRAKKSFGMKYEKYSFLYDISLSKRKDFVYDSYSLLAESLGVKSEDIKSGRKHFYEELIKISSHYSSISDEKNSNAKTIAFANGSDNIQRRNWIPSIKRLPTSLIWNIFTEVRQQIDGVFILLGTAEDTFPDKMETESSVIDMRDKTDIRRLIAILCQVDLLICNDTGTMHLAHFCGTPYIALFGPTKGANFAPDGVQSNIVTADGPCAPCHPKSICHSKQCKLLRQLETGKIVSLVKDVLNAKITALSTGLPDRSHI